MWYVEYVAGVAIANLFIGYGVAIATRPPTRGTQPDDHDTADHSGVADDNHPVSQSTQSASDSHPQHAEDPPLPITEPTDVPEKQSSPKADGSWPAIATTILNRTEALQSTLESVIQRLESAGAAITAAEAQPLAQQACDATTAWMTQATDITDQLFATAKTLKDGKNIASCCERLWFDQLAQTETVLSNFSMLDWNIDAAASAGRLLQETTRLNESCTRMRTKLQQLVELVYQPS